MGWTIINSIDLAKIYPMTDTRIIITDNFMRRQELTKFFDSFHIPYHISKSSLSTNNRIYFGSKVNFQSIYIIAGICKSYGVKEMQYKASLKEKITLGSIKRKTISSINVLISIDEVLNLAFDTGFYEFSTIFNLNSFEKINLDEYSLQQGWEISQSLAHEEPIDFDEDIDINVDELLIQYDTNHKETIDPYENFRWGGLSGEEAYIGYWNTD